MARSPANGTGSVTEATTLIFPKKSVWDELLKVKRETKKRASAQNGVYGSAVKDAVEKEHVDRKALAIVQTLAAMEDEDLHVTMFHLIDGLKKTGTLKRAMAQEEMFDEHRADAEALNVAAAGKKKGDKGATVTPIGDAARAVAEKAGEPFKH